MDGSFAVMSLLLAAHDAELGALFFAVFNGEQQLRIVSVFPSTCNYLVRLR
jgi:hypothetical protein